MKTLTKAELAETRKAVEELAPGLQPGSDQWNQLDRFTQTVARENPNLTPRQIVQEAVNRQSEVTDRRRIQSGIKSLMKSRSLLNGRGHQPK